MRNRRRLRQPVHDKAWHDEQMAKSGIYWPDGFMMPFDKFKELAEREMAHFDALSPGQQAMERING